ncbi:hypothetical protein ADL04_33645 [Streptomyces sp. NRRL B-3648]|nr:hypothetical protein ADL04_33645 [Streptomyces sp. NRRL B-3648]
MVTGMGAGASGRRLRTEAGPAGAYGRTRIRRLPGGSAACCLLGGRTGDLLGRCQAFLVALGVFAPALAARWARDGG